MGDPILVVCQVNVAMLFEEEAAQVQGDLVWGCSVFDGFTVSCSVLLRLDNMGEMICSYLWKFDEYSRWYLSHVIHAMLAVVRQDVEQFVSNWHVDMLYLVALKCKNWWSKSMMIYGRHYEKHVFFTRHDIYLSYNLMKLGLCLLYF